MSYKNSALHEVLILYTIKIRSFLYFKYIKEVIPPSHPIAMV